MLCLAGLVMLTPLLGLAAWPEERGQAAAFVLPGLLLTIGGLGLWGVLRPREPIPLTLREGGVIVLLSWVIVCLVSAWPLMLIHELSFAQAVFESVSGWTTTGLSVIDVADTSHLVLLWRSIMQLAGGAGLAVIMIASLAGPTGPGLPSAEGRSQQLVPHVRASAKLVLAMYSAYAALGTLACWLAGMGFFDAINHAFAAVSTGGFSTRPDSIGHWDSAAIEAAIIPLMLLGSCNFLTAYALIHGKIRTALRNTEIRFTALIVPLCAVLLFLLVSRSLHLPLGKGARVAVFETVSALTSTGFSCTSYGNWPAFGILILTILMLIGGGTGSTAGGIKQYRVALLLKSFAWDLVRAFRPRATVVEYYVWQGEEKDYIDDARVRQVATFVFLYLATWLIGAALLTAYGYEVQDSLFEFASAIGTVGLSLGVTAPDAPTGVLWIEAAGMFLGRLEFMVVIISLGRLTRDSLTMLGLRSQ
jgi:trk system potassium uptake protein TrkH